MSATTIGAHSRPAESRWAGARKALGAVTSRIADAAAVYRARLWSLRRAGLHVSAFTCIDCAAFQANLGTGLVTTGVSLLVLELLTDE